MKLVCLESLVLQFVCIFMQSITYYMSFASVTENLDDDFDTKKYANWHRKLRESGK